MLFLLGQQGASKKKHMKTDDFVTEFLNNANPIGEQKHFSMFSLLLISARQLSGRNLSTGFYEMSEIDPESNIHNTYIPNQFTGLINYLIILEQIGSLFHPKGINKRNEKTNEIELALENFSELEQQKRKAIKSLRNSLVHKFGLSTAKRDKENFRFSISNQRNDQIIIPAQWSGDFSEKSTDTLTVVYIRDLLDLIEKIIADVKEHWTINKIELKISIEELKSRYTVNLN
jgi:hypothetical protein